MSADYLTFCVSHFLLVYKQYLVDFSYSIILHRHPLTMIVNHDYILVVVMWIQHTPTVPADRHVMFHSHTMV